MVLQAIVLQAQYSLNGGLSTLKTFGNSKPYLGLHFGGEFPRDNETSFCIKLGMYARNQLDPNLYGKVSIDLENLDTNNYTIMSVSGDSYFNYTTIDGGMRYYILDGYDNGFSLYGGSNVMGIINRAKVKLDDFDETQYRLPTGTALKGTVLNMAIGFNGGAKYTIPAVGTVYLDMNFNYLLLSVASNSTASDIATKFMTSPVLFSFNLGFRKDFY